MLTVYFIRHGQAGSRLDYDQLSDLGRKQSSRLGSWLAQRQLSFEKVWSGRLARQRETAELARAASIEGGGSFPEILSHACWDEFDLDAVYRGIGPQLARDDEEFNRQYQELQVQMLDAESRIQHTWAHCDTTVVRAWIDRRYDCPGEPFEAFAARVRSGAEILKDGEGSRNVAVFTSATPAAVWAGMAFDLDGRRIMQLAGVTYNTAMTVIRIERERVRLFQFNTVPHLDTPELLTHR